MLKELRIKRKEKGYTTYDMADFLGLKSNSSYCKKELGYIPFNINEARKICKILKCSMDEIFLK